MRLARSVRPDGRANAELVELLSGRLYVLDRALAGIAAGAPTDVLVHLRASGADRGAEAEPFAALLAEMYVAWAEDRGMHVERLDAPSGEHLLSISGLGCGEILALESGFHVLEQVDEERDGAKVADREHVRVLVLPRPEGPEAGAGSLARLALHRVERPSPRQSSSGATARVARRSCATAFGGTGPAGSIGFSRATSTCTATRKSDR